MVKLNLLAAEPQFVQHLAAVWKVIPFNERGIFYVRSQEAEVEARKRRIQTKRWEIGRAHV